MQQFQRRARDLETRDFEHRRRLVLSRYAQVRAGYGDPRKQPHRQGVNLDVPVEARFEERLDFTRDAARGPFGVEQREAGAGEERQRDEHADRNPQQQPLTHRDAPLAGPGPGAGRHGLRLPATMMTRPATAASPPTIGGTGTCLVRSAVTSTGPMSTTFSVLV